VPLLSIYKGTIPFLIAPILLIAILMALPQVALYLPRLLYGN
jgi:TRAP-type mannitol/chloroaromatic compound transport system permease large subunit